MITSPTFFGGSMLQSEAYEDSKLGNRFLAQRDTHSFLNVDQQLSLIQMQNNQSLKEWNATSRCW